MKSEEKYDFCIVITTYEREDMLKQLLEDIFKYTEYKMYVVVFDDGSKQTYDLSEYDVKYIKYVKNNGLKNLWRVISDTFKFSGKIDAKYYFYFQDDLRLKENFFQESIRIFENISDENKISLGTLMIDTQRNTPKWTGVYPIEYDEYYKTQWCELVFMCEYKFFESLEFVLPCEWCKIHFKENIKQLPINNYLNSRRDLSFWLYKFHNLVNDSTSVPIKDRPSFESVYEKYDSLRVPCDQDAKTCGGTGDEKCHIIIQNANDKFENCENIFKNYWPLMLIIIAILITLILLCTKKTKKK